MIFFSRENDRFGLRVNFFICAFEYFIVRLLYLNVSMQEKGVFEI